MMLDLYNVEKMYEFDQKEREKAARDYWKWMASLTSDSSKNQKEVNDN